MRDDVSTTQAGLKEWEPLMLSPVHKKMIALHAAGLKPGEIADIVGYSQSRVSVILNDPRSDDLRKDLNKRFLKNLVGDVKSQIVGHSHEAFETVINLMRNAESERVRQKSAFDVLDRAGFKPKDVVVATNINVDADAAQEIREALRESIEDVEDVEFANDSEEVFHEAEWSLEPPSDAEPAS